MELQRKSSRHLFAPWRRRKLALASTPSAPTTEERDWLRCEQAQDTGPSTRRRSGAPDARPRSDPPASADGRATASTCPAIQCRGPVLPRPVPASDSDVSANTSERRIAWLKLSNRSAVVIHEPFKPEMGIEARRRIVFRIDDHRVRFHVRAACAEQRVGDQRAAQPRALTVTCEGPAAGSSRYGSPHRLR